MANPESTKKAGQNSDETSGGEFHDIGASAKEAASSTVTELKTRAQQMANRAQDMASDMTEKAQDYAGRAVRETGAYVKRHPAQSLLAGFGLGVIVGFILSARR